MSERVGSSNDILRRHAGWPVPASEAVFTLWPRWWNDRDALAGFAAVFLSHGVEDLPPYARLVLQCGALEQYHREALKLGLVADRGERDSERSLLRLVLRSLSRRDRGLVNKMAHGYFSLTFADRLSALLLTLPVEALELILGSQSSQEFVREVKETRNGVAHTGLSRRATRAVARLCGQLDMISAGLLLRRLGAPASETAGSLARHPLLERVDGLRDA
ncbi:HEPN domain-containing protein [Aquipuribacter sp. MA13-6]|uniref:HEPN domain-containing protein n=1 Tax=unclassified Aquipuribacter TaxID=2635084 RepID=UPI003EE89F03